MIKKLFLTFTLFALILTACASNSGMPASDPNSGSAPMELPAQTKLVLGIIQLDETENAVTAEQAEILLPMFHVLQDLNESDTAAQEEIDGLVNQIQETLTDEQVNAIESMNLSMQDMFAIVRGNGADSNSSETGSTSGGGGGGFGGPPDMGAGGPPDMGGGFGGSSSSSGDSESRPSGMNGTPSALFDAVIEYLQKAAEI